MRRECRERFPPPPISKETASWRSRHASRHVRDARAVMHVGIAHLRWRGKRSRHSRRMRTRNFTYLARGPWWLCNHWQYKRHHAILTIRGARLMWNIMKRDSDAATPLHLSISGIKIDSIYHINGLVQDYSNSSVLAMELLQYCSKPLILSVTYTWFVHCNGCLSRDLIHWDICSPANSAIAAWEFKTCLALTHGWNTYPESSKIFRRFAICAVTSPKPATEGLLFGFT